MDTRRLLIAATILLAGVAEARTNLSIHQPSGFDATEIQRVAIVVSDCHEVVDCHEVTRQAAEAFRLRSDLSVVLPNRTRDFLFENGSTAYDAELRGALFEEFGLDALVELEIPFAERGDGFGGTRRSSLRVDVTLVSEDGRILMSATGTRRPKNVVSGPERVLGKILEEFVDRVFGE